MLVKSQKEMKIDLKFYHFEQLIKNGYTLDMVSLLTLIEEHEMEILCCKMPKMEALCQAIKRKGLVTDEFKLTTAGKDLLTFLNTETQEVLVKKKPKEESFETWWKTYPGTDTFTYKEKSFTGTRGLRQKKDDCKLKFNKILNEGEYTAEDLIASLEYELKQKKENSIKTKSNKLSFMQNSFTYLNQRTFEPFIELIKEGKEIKETNQVQGGTDI
jgi:hypothetical protein